MKLEDVGEIIAVRYLFFEGETESKITVIIGKPQEYPGTSDYYCPIQIKGTGSEKVEYAVGIDAVQAIQLAFKWAGATLSHLNNTFGGRLRWEGGEPGDFGFTDIL
jgi:hypothetical protein